MTEWISTLSFVLIAILWKSLLASLLLTKGVSMLMTRKTAFRFDRSAFFSVFFLILGLYQLIGVLTLKTN